MTRATSWSSLVRVAFGFCALGVAACGSRIDRAAKADIDRRVAALSSSGAFVGPPASLQRIPPAPGQWARYKVTDRKGRPSFATFKIVGQEGDAFWIEIQRETYFGPNAQKLLVAFGSGAAAAEADVRAMFFRDPKGRVHEMPVAKAPVFRARLNAMVSSWLMSWQGLPQENELVPAGRFEGCFHAHKTLLSMATPVDSWSHPAVPLPGFVRSQGTHPAYTMELIAFGMTGATPSF